MPTRVPPPLVSMPRRIPELPARRYRLFVDEVGNSDMASSDNPNHMYLSLTGIAVEFPYYDSTLDVEMKALKQAFFESESLIFHRREMIDRKPPFQKFRDENFRANFDRVFLELLNEWKYEAITVVIDKKAHRDRYSRWHFHPYHYCMTCLLERYVKFLERQGGTGDVLSESRNTNEDRNLKESYQRFFRLGSRYFTAEACQRRLTSAQMKLKKKSENVNGLQLTDLIANPSFRNILCEKQGISMRANFG